mmetsp:Transcript_18824/g.52593  ORF Transcript_18824/g.52593 Transcript_18824/m.52593 type:complete len:225 (+) Transcript_18824:379-1053(+)
MTIRAPSPNPRDSSAAISPAATMRRPRSSVCSGVALLKRVSPLRSLGMTSTWAGAAGLMSRKASRVSSSLTIVAGISLRTILSKMVSGAVSRAPASQMESQRPLAPHFSRAPWISSYTLRKAGSASIMRSYQVWIASGIGGRSTAIAPSNFGNMYDAKTIDGKTVASARDNSPPHRYGPSSATKPAITYSCLEYSARASLRVPKDPKGGAARYRQLWMVVRYRS